MGKPAHIRLLVEIEETLRKQGLTAVRIRDNFDGKKLLKLLENEERQTALFEELICSSKKPQKEVCKC